MRLRITLIFALLVSQHAHGQSSVGDERLRANLGLGTLATQNAGAVAITGGTVTGVSRIWNTSAPGMNTPTIAVAPGSPPKAVQYIGAQLTGTPDGHWLPLVDWRFLDGMDHRGGTGGPMVRMSYATTPGSAGNGELLQLVCGTTANSVQVNQNFFTCFEPRSGPSNNVGGTSMARTYGQHNTMNPVSELKPGATFWNVHSIYENDIQTYYGASAGVQSFGQSVRLEHDWGQVGDASIPAYTINGRIGFWFNGAYPGYDPTSSGSARASAGNNMPAYRTMFQFGQGEWLGDSGTSFSEAAPQIYQNSNGCKVGVDANCPANTNPAPMRPQIWGDGFRWGNIHIANEAWRTPNYVVKGTGEIDTGNGIIAPTGNGLTIDAHGSKITGATWVRGAYHEVGEYIYGSGNGGTVPGAILKVTSVSGGYRGPVTGLAVVDPGYSPETAAANDASAAMGKAAVFTGGGFNTVRLTWSDTLDQGAGVAAVNIAPSGGLVRLGAGGTLVTVAGGAVIATNDIASRAGGFVGNGISMPNQGAKGGHGAIAAEGGNVVFKNAAGAAAGQFGMNDTAPGFTFNNETRFTGPVRSGGAAPGTPTSCGSGPSMGAGATDTRGIIHVGTGSPTSCTLNLAARHPDAPICVANAIAGRTPQVVSQLSATETTVTFAGAASLAGASIYYHCWD